MNSPEIITGYKPERIWPAIFILCICLPAMLLTACGAGGGNGSAGSVPEVSAAGAAPAGSHTLDVPVPPALLSESGAREFLSEHYWDNFDFADTTWIADTAALEKAFAGWARLLCQLPEPDAAELSGSLMRRADGIPAMLLGLYETAERFFDKPNSPFRNETLFIPVLEAVLASGSVDTLYRIRPRAQLALAMKNRPGMRAADFVYTRKDGSAGRLYGLDAEYTLLMFYAPDCPYCRDVERYIPDSDIFGPLVSSGRLKLLAVYPGKDTVLWREHLPEIPAQWTVGRDAQRAIIGGNLYDIRTTPMLYLLDRGKRVILKDRPVEQIESWFAQHADGR